MTHKQLAKKRETRNQKRRKKAAITQRLIEKPFQYAYQERRRRVAKRREDLRAEAARSAAVAAGGKDLAVKLGLDKILPAKGNRLSSIQIK